MSGNTGGFSDPKFTPDLAQYILKFTGALGEHGEQTIHPFTLKSFRATSRDTRDLVSNKGLMDYIKEWQRSNVEYIKNLLNEINNALKLNQIIRRDNIPARKQAFDTALSSYCDNSRLLFGELSPINFEYLKSSNKGYIGRKLNELNGLNRRHRIETLAPYFYEIQDVTFTPVVEPTVPVDTPAPDGGMVFPPGRLFDALQDMSRAVMPGQEEIMSNKYYENLEKKCDNIWDYLYMVCPIEPQNDLLYKHIVNECMRVFLGEDVEQTTISIKEKIIESGRKLGLEYEDIKLDIIVELLSRINESNEDSGIFDLLGGYKSKKSKKRKKSKKKKSKTKRKSKRKSRKSKKYK